MDKDNSSNSFKNLNIFSYDLSTFLIINSEIFGLTLICLSDNVFEIMTFNRSSVGNSIPINKKLLILDFKSSSLNSNFL